MSFIYKIQVLRTLKTAFFHDKVLVECAEVSTGFPGLLRITPATFGRDIAYCLKPQGGGRD